MNRSAPETMDAHERSQNFYMGYALVYAFLVPLCLSIAANWDKMPRVLHLLGKPSAAAWVQAIGALVLVATTLWTFAASARESEYREQNQIKRREQRYAYNHYVRLLTLSLLRPYLFDKFKDDINRLSSHLGFEIAGQSFQLDLMQNLCIVVSEHSRNGEREGGVNTKELGGIILHILDSLETYKDLGLEFDRMSHMPREVLPKYIEFVDGMVLSKRTMKEVGEKLMEGRPCTPIEIYKAWAAFIDICDTAEMLAEKLKAYAGVSSAEAAEIVQEQKRTIEADSERSKRNSDGIKNLLEFRAALERLKEEQAKSAMPSAAPKSYDAELAASVGID